MRNKQNKAFREFPILTPSLPLCWGAGEAAIVALEYKDVQRGAGVILGEWKIYR